MSREQKLEEIKASKTGDLILRLVREAIASQTPDSEGYTGSYKTFEHEIAEELNRRSETWQA